MQQMKFRFSILSCSSSQGTRVDPLYNAEFVSGAASPVFQFICSFFLRPILFAGLLRGNNPVSFFGTVFILQIASLLIPCCWASFPIIELRGHRYFSVLSPSLRRQSRKQPAAGSLCYDFRLFFGLHDSCSCPGAMTFACFSAFTTPAPVLCHNFCLFFDLHDSGFHPGAMTFAYCSNFRLTKNSVHLASRFLLPCLL
ncbi:hypothetical protein ILYODFUR_017166 [Ilyodon furcidens]|uniref:Uncharacterized protein n=1 Tax=Ilyodon furcidens TaxID=33524 RepID=A0ABV0UGT2_9TELE